MNFGTISGGTQPSTVADRCLIQLDRRYLPDESVESVLAEYRILDDLARRIPPSRRNCGECPKTSCASDHVPLETSPEDPLVTTLCSVLEDVGACLPLCRRGAVGPMRHF